MGLSLCYVNTSPLLQLLTLALSVHTEMASLIWHSKANSGLPDDGGASRNPIKTWQSSAIGVFRIDSHIVFQDEDIPGTVL